jgi:hypothetical protein
MRHRKGHNEFLTVTFLELLHELGYETRDFTRGEVTGLVKGGRLCERDT